MSRCLRKPATLPCVASPLQQLLSTDFLNQAPDSKSLKHHSEFLLIEGSACRIVFCIPSEQYLEIKVLLKPSHFHYAHFFQFHFRLP